MPVTWSINHEDRIVLAAAEGDTSLADLEQYMSAVAAAGGMPYRKLFDASYVTPGALRLSELRAFAQRVIALADGGVLGPIAIVVRSELEQEMAEAFGKADVKRPLAIFSEPTSARRWLEAAAA